MKFQIKSYYGTCPTAGAQTTYVETTAKAAISSTLGIAPELVQVKVSCGSLYLEVTIVPPAGGSVVALQNLVNTVLPDAASAQAALAPLSPTFPITVDAVGAPTVATIVMNIDPPPPPAPPVVCSCQIFMDGAVKGSTSMCAKTQLVNGVSKVTCRPNYEGTCPTDRVACSDYRGSYIVTAPVVCTDTAGKWASTKCAKKFSKGKCSKKRVKRNCGATCGCQ